jgi:two-component system KDP operon response regulator KdpE
MSDVQRDPEARLIYVLCIALTAPIIIAALARGIPIGPGTTLCMLIAAAGVIGLVVDWRHRLRIPRAQLVARRRRPTSPNRVLVVEDEPALQELLRRTLVARGIDVVVTSSLAGGLHALEATRPAAVLLDLGLPDGDGIELLRSVRAHGTTPVIVVSARDRAEDRTLALDAGADDYVLKPFDAPDLVTRVQHVMQRAPDATVKLGTLEIDPARDPRLGTHERKVLALLARRRGALVGYRELMTEVWGAGSERDVAELRIVVAALRRKLEHDPARPRWLVAEPGGYRLRADPTARSKTG